MRGISPLVVALLLILVGIAATIVLYMWLTGFTTSATQLPAEMKINIRIEAANITDGGSHDYVILYVRNVGSTTIDLGAIKNVAVYVYYHYNGTVAYTNTTAAAEPVRGGDNLIEPGELFIVNATSDSDVIAKGEYYDVKVVISGVEAWIVGVKAQG